jgi:hypothetical protein
LNRALGEDNGAERRQFGNYDSDLFSVVDCFEAKIPEQFLVIMS